MWTAWVLSALLGLSVSCDKSGPEAGRPRATWAYSPEAQQAFRRLVQRFSEAAPDERLALEPEIVAFLQEHPGDARTRVAQAYLAWIYVQTGRLGDARRLAKRLRTEYPGTVGDFARLIEGAILIRQRRPEQALALLEPLRGKLISAEENVLFGGELVRAALHAKQYESTATYMVDWLEHAQGLDRDTIQSEVEALLRDAPASLLEEGAAALELEAALDTSEARSPRATARGFLQKAFRTRLTRVALSKRDVLLARRLLEATPPSFKPDPTQEALARLAAEGRVEPRIHGRAVGFVIRADDADSRRRSTQVLSGIARALSLPASAADPKTVRLVTREAADGEEGVSEALSSLAGDGAAILVAGVSEEGALSASLFAERAKIPVMLLHDAQRLAASLEFTFVLGADPVAVQASLEEALLERGFGVTALVGKGGVPCDAHAIAGQMRFPVAAWRKSALDALVLLGDARCSRDAIAEHDQAGLTSMLALSLDSAELHSVLPGRKLLVTAAGRFPSGAGGDIPPDMREFQSRAGAPPTWFEALGHDAGTLAKKVLSSFPLERVDAASQVAELHRLARDALSVASASLWTTSASGFGNQRRMPRDIRLLALEGQK